MANLAPWVNNPSKLKSDSQNRQVEVKKSFHLEYNIVKFLMISHPVNYESQFLNRTTGGEEDRGQY